MDEFTLIYDNIVMALEMEQIDKVNVSTKANNIEKKKNERNVIRIQQMELKRRS